MTRMSKKGKRRAVSPRKHRMPCAKTGSKMDSLTHGYKPHENAVVGNNMVFIGKIK